MGRLALRFVLVGVFSNYLAVVDGGATVEEVLTNCTEDNVEEWREKVEDLEEKMKTLEDENKYLKTKSYKTCHDLKNSPFSESGLYWLDPDFSGTPIQLFCDMENGITEVGHNHETTQNVTWCRGEGCYTLGLEYTVPDDKIEAIISMSEHCEQQILFQCKMAPLKNTAFGQFYYGWWVDRHGENQYYFDGDNKDEHVCGCYNEKSCTLSSFKSSCHCDSSLMPLWNSDSGKITNKVSLPIRQFKYGAFFSEHQAAKVTIGKLRCSGKPKSRPHLTSTCASLKKSGLLADGFYLLKDEPSDNLKPGFCALSKSGYSEPDLRIDSEETLTPKTFSFNVTSFKCTSCSCTKDGYGRSQQSCHDYHRISNIVTQDSSPHISIDNLGGTFSVKTEGLYLLFLPVDIYINLYLGDTPISGKWSLQWIEKNGQISFKTRYDQMEKPFGTFAIKKVA